MEIWKICEKLFLSEKNPTSIFKIGGILQKKMFRKFIETSVIISLSKGYSTYFTKKFKNFFKWKKIQLEISKLGILWKTKLKISKVGVFWFQFQQKKMFRKFPAKYFKKIISEKKIHLEFFN